MGQRIDFRLHKKPRIVCDLEFASQLPSEVGTFFKVKHLDVAGLAAEKNSEKLFYCRQDTLDQLKALNEMENGVRIRGPPGIGKSITTWLWLCNQVHVHKKTALWIQVYYNHSNTFLNLTEDGIEKLSLRTEKNFISLNCWDIVVMDGIPGQFKSGLIPHVFSRDFDHNRKSVSIASFMDHYSFTNDRMYRISHFDAVPWTLEEYRNAIKNNEFYEQVLPKLVEGDQSSVVDSIESRWDFLERKYYYGGTSARWTWDVSIPDIIERVEQYVEWAGGFNRAFQNYEDAKYLTCRYRETTFFTSQYAAERSMFCFRIFDDDVVKKSYRCAIIAGNSFKEWISRADFILQVWNSKRKSLELKDCSWQVADLLQNVEVNKENLLKVQFLDKFIKGLWIVSKPWNLDAYDLVDFIDADVNESGRKTFTMRFVQVARGSSSSLDLRYIKNFIDCMKDALDCEIAGLEIVFIVPDDAPESSKTGPMIKSP